MTPNSSLPLRILGDPRCFSLEERLFHAMTLLNGILNMIGAGGALTQLNGVFLAVVQLLSGAALVLFYLLSRFRIVRRGLFWPFVICLVVFLTLNILSNAGSLGGAHQYLITAGVIVVALGRSQRDTWFALGLLSALNLGLAYLEQARPEAFTFYDWPEALWRTVSGDPMRYYDVATNSLFALLLTAIIALILAQAFRQERERSDKLLLNILPGDVAAELRLHERVEPREYASATILFTDFQGFTALAAKTSAHDLVADLDQCFSRFDRIVQDHGIEKIKTIGDAYMAAGGLPKENSTHALDATRAALAMLDAVERINVERIAAGKPPWLIRIGLHTGRLVAGVIGTHKFAYDVWGDAVNVASRMESTAIPGTLNLSAATYRLVRDHITGESRGLLPIKNHGEIEAYVVRGR